MKQKEKNFINAEHHGKGFARLSSKTNGLAKKLLGAKGIAEIELLANWKSIIGDDLSDYTLPQKIEFPKNSRNGGTLYLLTANGAFAIVIQHKTPFILEKINMFFGYQAVSKIKVIQNDSFSPAVSQPKFDDKPEKKLVTEQEQNYISQMTEEIQNPELKKRLQQLGESIITNNK